MANSNLVSQVAVEFRLLSSADNDTFSVLASVLEGDRPWTTQGWPFTSSTNNQIRKLVTAALLPNAPRDARRESMQQLIDFTEMIPLHGQRVALVDEAKILRWNKTGDIDGEHLIEWLHRAKAIGADVESFLALAEGIQSSTGKDFIGIRPEFILALLDLERENPADLLQRHRALANES